MDNSPALSLSVAEIEQAGALLTDFLRTFEQSVPTRSVVPVLDRAALSELLTDPFPEDGLGIEQMFRQVSEKVVPNSTAIAHPRFLAYVLGPPNGIAPFAEAIAATLNQNCNFWQLSPAASVIERKVISWLAQLFQYPASSGGLFTSGGSMATLVALATAIQDKYSGDFRQAGLQSILKPLVVYTSEEAHRCVEKDAVILGLGLGNVHKIPADANFRIRLDLLQAAVREDRSAGKQPFCLVAAAGTVNTGAIDPIEDLADFCAEQNLWLHVDGAYGGLFVLSERIRCELLPCSRADSIALDPHKLLFAPLEAGCLLVRDRDKLRRAFRFASDYLSVDEDPLLTNYLEYGPQLSRSFKALKVWCALQVFGVKAFRDVMEETLDLARYLEKLIQRDPGWELLAPVHLNAVCFRIRDSDDARNQSVLSKLVDEGAALLGPVRIRGKMGLRACVTNYRTTKADIDLIWGRLKHLAAMHLPPS